MMKKLHLLFLPRSFNQLNTSTWATYFFLYLPLFLVIILFFALQKKKVIEGKKRGSEARWRIKFLR